MCSHKDYFYTSNCNTGTCNCLVNLIIISKLALRKYDEFYVNFPTGISQIWKKKISAPVLLLKFVTILYEFIIESWYLSQSYWALWRGWTWQ